MWSIWFEMVEASPGARAITAHRVATSTGLLRINLAFVSYSMQGNGAGPSVQPQPRPQPQPSGEQTGAPLCLVPLLPCKASSNGGFNMATAEEHCLLLL